MICRRIDYRCGVAKIDQVTIGAESLLLLP